MHWPQSGDYNEVIQNPKFHFSDPELMQGQPALNSLELPVVSSGNFAVVYKIQCANIGTNWAVKCFTRKVLHQRARYRAISNYLKQANLPFIIGFDYLPAGIRVRGQWYPILKMEWVEGTPLNRFVQANLSNRGTLETLFERWLDIARCLRAARLAHADLQHGNVLVMPHVQRGFDVKLVDYDGMFVPELAGTPSDEFGHPDFQNPRRYKEATYNSGLDCFPHLVIGCALRALMLGGKELWSRYDNGENLLFKQKDFEAPQDSKLFRELWRSSDTMTRLLVGQLIRATTLAVGQEPFLPDLLGSGQPHALSEADERDVEAILSRPSTRSQPTASPVQATTALSIDVTVSSANSQFPVVTTPKMWPILFGQVAVAPPAVTQPRPAQPPANVPTSWQSIFASFFLCIVVVVLARQWRGSDASPVPVVPVPPPPNPTLAPITVEMNLIPAGEFVMGSPSTEAGHLEEEGPQHLVRLTEPFYLGQYEVTQGQYELLMGTNPSFFNKTEPQVRNMDTSMLPVEEVSWFDAIEFCNRLSANHSLPPYYTLSNVTRGANPSITIIMTDGTKAADQPTAAYTIRSALVSTTGSHGYRLPTEAEWEYACRATSTSPFHFAGVVDPSSEVNSEKANINVRPRPGGAIFPKSHWRTTTIGSYEPNHFGLFDMHGNVAEWCWDWHDDKVYSQFTNTTAINPIGPSSGRYRVLRGGSWKDLCVVSRSASRPAAMPQFSGYTAGFRVARTAESKVDRVVASKTKPSLAPAPIKGLPTNAPAKSIEPKPAPNSPPPDSIKAGLTVAIDMRLIPVGEFTMGSSESQAGYSASESPTHTVKIARPFYIGAYEVTQQEYEQVMGNNPSYFSKGGGGSSLVSGRDVSRFPVENVSWLDAVEFCNKLSMQEKRSPYYQIADDKSDAKVLKGDGYRLPTEAEWEYACRASSGTYAFNTGTRLNGDEANIDGTHNYILKGEASVLAPERGKHNADGKYLERTTVVGSYRPNSWGLFDMHGNVYEWCFDWYASKYYSQFSYGTAIDPTGPLTSTDARAVRGGSWKSRPHESRSASRLGISPDVRRKDFGFRVARSL